MRREQQTEGEGERERDGGMEKNNFTQEEEGGERRNEG